MRNDDENDDGVPADPKLPDVTLLQKLLP